jgi:hypothetical protein
VQIVIADVDANGRALSTCTSFALSGQVRAQGEGDDSLNRLATRAGCKLELVFPCGAVVIDAAWLGILFFSVLRNVWSYSK